MHVQYYVLTVDYNGFIVDTVTVYDMEDRSIADVAFDLWENYAAHNKSLCKGFFVCLDHYGIIQLDIYLRKKEGQAQ